MRPSVPRPGELLYILDRECQPALCAQLCGARGFPFMSLSRGEECLCSIPAASPLPRMDSSMCRNVCTGADDYFCGGAQTSDLYALSNVFPKSHMAKAPRFIVLVMVLENDSAVLPRTLASVAPFIDAYHVVDLGSSDASVALIKDFLGHVPGQVVPVCHSPLTPTHVPAPPSPRSIRRKQNTSTRPLNSS